MIRSDILLLILASLRELSWYFIFLFIFFLFLLLFLIRISATIFIKILIIILLLLCMFSIYLFLDSKEIFLCVRSDLSSSSCANMIFYFLPVLSKEFYSLNESDMFLSSPATCSFADSICMCKFFVSSPGNFLSLIHIFEVIALILVLVVRTLYLVFVRVILL